MEGRWVNNDQQTCRYCLSACPWSSITVAVGRRVCEVGLFLHLNPRLYVCLATRLPTSAVELTMLLSWQQLGARVYVCVYIPRVSWPD